MAGVDPDELVVGVDLASDEAGVLGLSEGAAAPVGDGDDVDALQLPRCESNGDGDELVQVVKDGVTVAPRYWLFTPIMRVMMSYGPCGFAVSTAARSSSEDQPVLAITSGGLQGKPEEVSRRASRWGQDSSTKMPSPTV